MNEKGDVGKIWALAAAKERGDTQLAEYLDRKLSESVTLREDGKGGTFADEVSTMMAICYAMAKLTVVNYLHEAIANGPPEYTFRGPLLDWAPYPEILVPRAWSNGKYLDLVLYGGCDGRLQMKMAKQKYR
ncbi:hypothetical protein N7490_011831 [Penicillium lividum]|nr:hypothetical protein N7490_011831 [Penicillium lividum]